MTRRFFANAAVIAAAEMFARVKGFATIPLLTHGLGPTGYGVWSQVAVVAVLLGPVIMLGTDAGIVRYLPGTSRAERSERFAGWALAIALGGAVVCGAVAILRRPLAVVVFGSGPEYARFVPLAAASVMTGILLNLARTWYRLENDARRISLLTIAQALLSLAAIIAWYALGYSLYALVGYTVAADAVLAVAVVGYIALASRWTRPDFSLMPRLVRYGVALLPAGYAVWALNWADRLFLVHYADLRAVGIYSLAYSLGYLLVQVVVNPLWAMFPNVFAEEWNLGRRADAQRLFERTAGAILGLTAPIIAGGFVLGGTLLGVLAPTSFGGAGLVFPLVLGGYLCFMLSAFYEVSFGLVDRQGLGALTVVAACGLNILLNFLLIPPYGYIGASVATLGAFAFELVMCLALARRLGTLSTPLGAPVRIVAASLGVLAVLAPVQHFFLHGGYVDLLVGAGVGAVVYGALCMALGLVHPTAVRAELRRVRGRFRPGALEA